MGAGWKTIPPTNKTLQVDFCTVAILAEWSNGRTESLLRPFGSLIPLLLPPYLIGLLGIVPMAIGARRLVQIIRKDGNTSIIPPFFKKFTRMSLQLWHRWVSLVFRGLDLSNENSGEDIFDATK